MHSWAAVILMSWQFVNASDFGNDHSLPLLCDWQISVCRFVICRAGDFEYAAKNFDRPVILMLFDELESQLFSFTKKAVAFFVTVHGFKLVVRDIR